MLASSQVKGRSRQKHCDVKRGEMIYPHPIFQNALPQCDSFDQDGYTKEEMKLSNETNKILDKEIKVTATAVRIPVMGGHSESVNIEFKNSVLISDVRSILSTTSGVTVQDTISKFEYPMPYYSSGKDDVFVGRIREDFSCTNSCLLYTSPSPRDS